MLAWHLVATLLVIEDELVLAHRLRRALKAAGHQVRGASTAAEGLEAARFELPDLVLLDLRLPDRSGLEVLAELRFQCRLVLVQESPGAVGHLTPEFPPRLAGHCFPRRRSSLPFGNASRPGTGRTTMLQLPPGPPNR